MELTSLSGLLRGVFPLRTPLNQQQQNFERHLVEGEVWSLLPTRDERLTVHCYTGSCWITRTSSAEDLLLHAGESRTWQGSGQVVLQAMSPESRMEATLVRKGAFRAD